MKRTIFSYFSRIDPEVAPKKNKEQVDDANLSAGKNLLETNALLGEPMLNTVSVNRDVEIPDGRWNARIQQDEHIFSPNDIGIVANNLTSGNSSGEPLEILENTWVPPAKFIFPKSTVRNLSFQIKWLEEYHWLAYSAKDDGGYCKYCVAFGIKTGGKGGIKLGNLVTKPFKIWKKAKETFKL